MGPQALGDLRPAAGAGVRLARSRRNVLLNAAGLALPMVAALLAVPFLLRYVGSERFGAFALVLALVAYASVLDLGLGTAITYRLASGMRDGAPAHEQALAIRSATIAAGALGIVVGVAWFAVSGPIAAALLPSQPALLDETSGCLRVLSLAAPALFASAVSAGALSAYGEFGRLNIVRIPAGLLIAAVPPLAVAWSQDLVTACWMLVAVRYGASTLQLLLCKDLVGKVPGMTGYFSVAALRGLIGYGSWLTVSNTIGPFMVYMDRFYLAAVRSTDHVTQYVTAFELASKLLLLPALALPVVFPLFVHPEEDEQGRLPVQLSAGILVVVCVFAVIAGAFAPEIMRVWTAGVAMPEGVFAFRMLAAAALVNCVAQVSFTRVQAQGRTRVIAQVHAVELAAYAALLWQLADRFGVVGVSCAWAVRAIVDAAVFCWLGGRGLADTERRRLRNILVSAVAVAAAIVVAGQFESIGTRTLLLALPPAVLILWWPSLRPLVFHAASQDARS